MIFQTSEETVKNVLTTFPENFYFSDVLLWIGTSVLLTWLFSLTLCGKKRHPKLRVFVLTAAGMLGVLGYLLYQNLNENLGGYYLNGKVSDEILLPKVEKAAPGSPGKDYLIYFPGSILGRRLHNDIVKTDTCAVVPHGYAAEVRRFARKLRENGHRLHLVGFSRGGGEALAVALTVREPIASLVLVDPTGDILQALECRLMMCPKPHNVEFFKVFTVKDYHAATASNDAIRYYHFFMIAKFIDPQYVEYVDSGDHGMYSTGYRIDESSREALEKLRSLVLSDRNGRVIDEKVDDDLLAMFKKLFRKD